MWMNEWINECVPSTVEWHWQGKTEVFAEYPVPVQLRTSQVSYGTASNVNGGRITGCAMAHLEKNWVKTAVQPRVEQWSRQLERKVRPRHLTRLCQLRKVSRGWWHRMVSTSKEKGWGVERRRKWLVSKRHLRNSLEKLNTNRRNLIPHTR